LLSTEDSKKQVEVEMEVIFRREEKFTNLATRIRERSAVFGKRRLDDESSPVPPDPRDEMD